jgi:pimeloyl-ACP methyl ester carboxylesterase
MLIFISLDTSFTEFISCPEMKGLRERIMWIHVDLPGQEVGASDLKISKYPTMIDLANELILVLDHLKINQVTCLGEGSGANIVTRFAMRYPNRCMGVALIHPTGSTAGFMEHFKDKLTNLLPSNKSHANRLSYSSEEYLIWHRYGRSNQMDQLVQANIKDFQKKLYSSKNPKNLDLLINAFLKYIEFFYIY